MLTFRNVDADPADDPAMWPFEAKITAVERGELEDYRRIKAACDRDPSTRAAFLDACDLLGDDPGAALVRLWVEGLPREERAILAARRMRSAVERSGLSRAQAAARLGTSTSRLSTYLSGRVVPRADLYEAILALG
ncbi:helix-turn-helix transcriptional regulator [Actinomyces sp. MRS3W]|uniref:helix-turn-helix domain-containing protein n=1 Tax=Actinomyces sp. MRS3W TaxID=2800796 RepID=UPI0028FD1EF3|nr:helix-turn-helix transcriptional regulator [Actinomyces sp. MRS3W]MDU0349442.1 helix-turn-helix transcriptional regulator [Actinomyces sp. MRS3W]